MGPSVWAPLILGSLFDCVCSWALWRTTIYQELIVVTLQCLLLAGDILAVESDLLSVVI